MSSCCCSLAGTAACKNCANNPYATGADGVMAVVNHLRTYVEPQTNADHIRAMTDEELAEWMATIEKNCYARCGFKSNFKRFNNQWLDWLKDTVKEADE